MNPVLQRGLFDADTPAAPPAQRGDPGCGGAGRWPGGVGPAAPMAQAAALAATLAGRHAGRLHLGTSSWHFPGWAGQVWDRPHPPSTLSRHGLSAYAAHPLLNAVGLDRSFYRALDAGAYATLAAQVPPGFRFVVKAPAAVSDALLRDPATGAPLAGNPSFLDPALALELGAAPAAAGLGDRLGVLVFQLSPLPVPWLRDQDALHERLRAMFERVLPALPARALAALEVRDPALLTPTLAALLRGTGVRYCIGIHDRMPDLAEQLPLLRGTWPGDLVCRWNLQRGERYAQRRDRWAPFDRLQSPDAATRQGLASLARATLDAGHRVFITVNNKAEGCAPRSVLALAEAIAGACADEIPPRVAGAG